MTAKPGLGQGTLPEMPVMEQLSPSEGFDIQKNFVSFAVPERWGLDRADYDDITSRELGAAAPDRLEPFLIGVKSGSSGEVSMRSVDDINRPVLLRIALNPQEYGHITRNVGAVGRAVVNQTLASRAGANFIPHGATATRSGIHALQKKQEKMEHYLSTTLSSEQERLNRFIEYSTNPHFRRRKGLDTFIEMGWIQEQIFGNILSVIGLQKGWDEQQADLAKRAIQYRLFFDRGHNQHIANWHGMLQLSQRYNQARVALYKDRIYQTKQYIKKHAE